MFGVAYPIKLISWWRMVFYFNKCKSKLRYFYKLVPTVRFLKLIIIFKKAKQQKYLLKVFDFCTISSERKRARKRCCICFIGRLIILACFECSKLYRYWLPSSKNIAQTIILIANYKKLPKSFTNLMLSQTPTRRPNPEF